jgi:hypothetical protein
MNTIKTTSGDMSDKWSHILYLSVWAGIIGPILYILVFTLDGALRRVILLTERLPVTCSLIHVAG